MRETPVAFLTAAPHQHGKGIGLQLARAGADVLLGGLGSMRARARGIEEIGRQARPIRFNRNDPRSVQFALLEAGAFLQRLRLVVHLGAEEMDGLPERLDPFTEATGPYLGPTGTILYVLEDPKLFPAPAVQSRSDQGPRIMGLHLESRTRTEAVARGVERAWREPGRFGPGLHHIDAVEGAA